MVQVTQNGHKVMVVGTTHVCWAQHRSLKVQHMFEKPKLRYMTFENSFMEGNRNIAWFIIFQKNSKSNSNHGQPSFDQENGM